MTAALVSRQEKSFTGVRPVDPRRDMSAIADLIESAFPLDFDPEGRRMIRDMRAYGQAGLIGFWLGRLVLPPAAHPMGFVWEEDGNVVGNASLLRVDGFPHRWVLANVVVRADYRRRGIGRALTQASIDLATDRKAKELFLQVDSSNKGAQILYASLGFHPRGTRNMWVRSSNQMPQNTLPIGQTKERRAEDWKAQFEFARRFHSEGLVWPYPLTSRLYRGAWLQRLMGMIVTHHWIWEEDSRLMGSLTARSLVETRRIRFILVVDPERRGDIEGFLLGAGLQEFQDKHKPILLDYPVGKADQVINDLGFRSHRTLTWMSNEL